MEGQPPHIEPESDHGLCGICPALQYPRERFVIFDRPCAEAPFNQIDGHRYTAEGEPACVHPHRIGLAADRVAALNEPLPPATSRTAASDAGCGLGGHDGPRARVNEVAPACDGEAAITHGRSNRFGRVAFGQVRLEVGRPWLHHHETCPQPNTASTRARRCARMRPCTSRSSPAATVSAEPGTALRIRVPSPGNEAVSPPSSLTAAPRPRGDHRGTRPAGRTPRCNRAGHREQTRSGRCRRRSGHRPERNGARSPDGRPRRLRDDP